MTPWQPISKDSLVQRLAVELRDQITSGKLAVGDRLPPEPELAAQFGVSRPLLREVLAELRAEGFVRTLTGRGTFVSHPTEADLVDSFALQVRLSGLGQGITTDQLYEARATIELRCAELAAERATKDELATLERLLDSMFECREDAAGYTAADVGFHVTVAKASGNPVLPTLLLPITSLIVEGVFESHGASGATDLGIAAHSRILEALRTHDAMGAREAMWSHLQESRTMFPEPVAKRRRVSSKPVS